MVCWEVTLSFKNKFWACNIILLSFLSLSIYLSSLSPILPPSLTPYPNTHTHAHTRTHTHAHSLSFSPSNTNTIYLSFFFGHTFSLFSSLSGLFSLSQLLSLSFTVQPNNFLSLSHTHTHTHTHTFSHALCSFFSLSIRLSKSLALSLSLTHTLSLSLSLFLKKDTFSYEFGCEVRLKSVFPRVARYREQRLNFNNF